MRIVLTRAAGSSIVGCKRIGSGRLHAWVSKQKKRAANNRLNCISKWVMLHYRLSGCWRLVLVGQTPFDARIRHRARGTGASKENSTFSARLFVCTSMSNRVRETDRLRGLYDNAFREWAFAMSRLQEALQTGSQGLAVLEAERRSEAAEAAYRESRDRLAEALCSACGVV